MPLVPGVARQAAQRSPKATLSLVALFAALIVTLLVAAPSASARSVEQGGVSARSGLEAEIPESTEAETGEGAEYEPATSKAALIRGRAIAPLDAPTMVKRVIAFANHIRKTPYIWGGGHGRFVSNGYDCSGAVSFALHGGRLLSSPLTSGSMESYGEAGPGRWITIYANAQHAYMVVAGLRFDTAGDENETGPRWHLSTEAAASGRFIVRHPVGY